MTVLCDFQVIQGDADQRIGDGAIIWEKIFSTSGRYPGGLAILMLMVQGLTYATQPVNVKINNMVIGQIFPYRFPNPAERQGTSNHWHTQIINIGPNVLIDGDNEIQIEAIGFPGATGSNAFDDFQVRDVVCLYQQDS